MCVIPITTAYKTVASVVYGLCQLAQPGLVLKYGAAAAMAAAHVVANSLQWAAAPVVILEKQLELLRATHIEYVPAAQAAALKLVKAPTDSLAMWSIPLRPHTQLAYVPAVATAATAHVFIQ
jgi:hypothetical protein